LQIESRQRLAHGRRAAHVRRQNLARETLPRSTVMPPRRSDGDRARTQGHLRSCVLPLRTARSTPPSPRSCSPPCCSTASVRRRAPSRTSSSRLCQTSPAGPSAASVIYSHRAHPSSGLQPGERSHCSSQDTPPSSSMSQKQLGLSGRPSLA